MKKEKRLAKTDEMTYFLNGACVYITTEYGQTVYIDTSTDELTVSACLNCEDEKSYKAITIPHKSSELTPSG